MVVEAVASAGDDGRPENGRRAKVLFGRLKQVRDAVARLVAIAAAERNVPLWLPCQPSSYKYYSWKGLTSGHDEDRAVKLALGRRGPKRQQLANGRGLARQGRNLKDLGIKLMRREEVGLQPDGRLGGQISLRVLVGEVLDALDGDKVGAQQELGQEVADLAEAGEDDAVAQPGVCAGHAEGDGRAKRVANVHHLAVPVLAAAQLAALDPFGEALEGGHLEEDLYLVDGVAVGRVGDPEPVPRQDRVALVDGAVDVAVVVVVVGEMPVGAREADAVRDDVEGVAAAPDGLAVGRRELVVAPDRPVLGPLASRACVSGGDLHQP